MNLHSSHQIQSSRFGVARRQTLHTRGLAVARLLCGAWRDARRPAEPARELGRLVPELSAAELTEITPLLCRSGAGALAWRRLRDTALADCPAALQLREVYRRQRLSALLHEREIAPVITLLRAEGIEPVLIKGWAIARRYPDRALRPYGDIDLCVRPDSHAHARRVLARIASINGPFVDLHCGFAQIGQKKTVQGRTKTVQSPRSKVQSLSALRRLWTADAGLRTMAFGLWSNDSDDWDELYERSQVVRINESKVLSAKSKVSSEQTDLGPWTLDFGHAALVRILRDEDHLRVLCRHLLRSGAHRPPWLCDVALLLEQISGFDWEICIGRNPVDANWIGVVVQLAHELLGARIDHTPFANQKLPAWLVPAVLEQWGGKRVQSPKSKVQSQGKVQRADIAQGPTAKLESLLSADRLWTLDFGPWTSLLDLGLWTNLYHRWDNPIRSTAAVGGRFDERSRLPYRVLESAMRITTDF